PLWRRPVTRKRRRYLPQNDQARHQHPQGRDVKQLKVVSSLSEAMRGPLLASAGARVRMAVIAVIGLWLGVLWASLAQPPPAPSGRAAKPATPALRLVVASGQVAPVGGSFDRFDIASQPVVAPVNARGHVAFYASVVRSKAREGIFLSMGSRIAKVAAIGDPVPGGGFL